MFSNKIFKGLLKVGAPPQRSFSLYRGQMETNLSPNLLLVGQFTSYSPSSLVQKTKQHFRGALRFVSMTTDIRIAKEWADQGGYGCFEEKEPSMQGMIMKIDPSHFPSSHCYSIATYLPNEGNEERVNKEKEKVTTFLPGYAIEYFFINGRKLDNPLYLPASLEETEKLYNNFIEIMRRSFEGNLKVIDIQQYVDFVIQTYNSILGAESPFKLTLRDFKKKFFSEVSIVGLDGLYNYQTLENFFRDHAIEILTTGFNPLEINQSEPRPLRRM